MTDFSTFSLDEKLLQAISEQGYETPTPVQQQAIPPLLKGRDVLGRSAPEKPQLSLSRYYR